MELVINKSNLRNLEIECKPKEKFVRGHLLNSNYKRLAERNFSDVKPTSIFAIRRNVKIKAFQSSIAVETILKVAIFATLLGFLI